MSSSNTPLPACIRPDVRAMRAYTVAQASGLIKLDAMENPYPLAPQLQQRWGSVWRNWPSTATPALKQKRSSRR